MSYFFHQIHQILEWARIVDADPKTVTVEIRKGDTLSAIAQGMTGCSDQSVADVVAEIMALNPDIKDADKIYAGQIIKIPA